MKLIYIAGPYRGDVARNIAQAREIAAEVWRRGHVGVCPHTMSAHFDRDYPDIPDERYLEGDMMILSRCDGMVLTPDWQTSQGARDEARVARDLGMPIWVYPDLPEER